MLCTHPYVTPAGLEVRCNRCMPCRINKRREWTCRGILEASTVQESAFLTMTYSKETCPVDGSVSAPALKLFLRRLSWSIGPFRYLAVGEYGERSLRPHYHAVIFGRNPTLKQVRAAWSKDGQELGHCFVGTVTRQSLAYCVGYTIKKLSKAEDPRLGGRAPEFMRCSLRPGIGARAIPFLATWYSSKAGCSWLTSRRDVCSVVRFDGKIYPLGRYLVGKLREAVGIPSSDPLRVEAMLSDKEALELLPDYAATMAARRAASGRAAAGKRMIGRAKEVL